MPVIYILILLLSVLLPDLYIWLGFVRCGHALWSALHWAPSLLLAACLVNFALGRYSVAVMRSFFFLLLAFALPKLLFTLVSLLGEAFSVLWPAASAVGDMAGLAASLLLFAAVIYGFVWGWRHVVTREAEVVSADLPAAFDGYRIVQLSDFHIGTYASSPSTVGEIVERVNALRPDMIAFTGDLVNVSPDEVTPFKEVLSRLQAPDGVYSVLGNHDYCEYRRYASPDGQRRSLEALERHERDMGWRLLVNESRVVSRGEARIAVVGVENDGRPPFPSRADMAKALRGLDGAMYKVLLSHDPTHWRRNVLPETDIQLTLSGHTHAMQLRVGRFSPSMWTYKEWGGLYSEGGRSLHVSTGTGGNVAFRLGAWPEIDVIVLRRPEGAAKAE